jgi:hypothetical protein
VVVLKPLCPESDVDRYLASNFAGVLEKQNTVELEETSHLGTKMIEIQYQVKQNANLKLSKLFGKLIEM